MAWMMDTYSMQKGYAVPEIVTGKPISIGGSVFRHEATGAGVVMVVERACRRLGWDLAEQRCVVQGFGNVGGIAATELHESGRRVIAVSDVSGGVLRADGLDVPTLHAYVAEHGSLEGYADGRRANQRTSELLELECDILVLAAREDQVTGANAGEPAVPARRRRRERPDLGRGRRDPRRARHARAARHPHERGRRDGRRTSNGCRTSAGSSGTATRSAAAWRTRCPTRSTASGTSPRSGASRCATRRWSPRSAKWRLRSRRAGLSVSVTEQLVRDAMVPDPLALDASATAQDAGDRARAAEVRAVFVCATAVASSASSRARRSCARSWRAGSTRNDGARLDRRAAERDARVDDCARPMRSRFSRNATTSGCR